MAVSYAPLLVTEETREWLEEQSRACPSATAASRWPTPKELREVLEALAGYSVSYAPNDDGGWDAHIVDARHGTGHEGWRASIWVENAPDDDTPTAFTFHKPSVELALTILERLARVCGPLALSDSSTGGVVVVEAGAKVSSLAAELLGE